jgi:phage terminase large subunit
MDFEVFVTEESSNIWMEFREYRWALDRNKNPLDEPEDANNHACDAIRMIIAGKGRYY